MIDLTTPIEGMALESWSSQKVSMCFILGHPCRMARALTMSSAYEGASLDMILLNGERGSRRGS